VDALTKLLAQDDEYAKTYNKKNKRRVTVRSNFHKSLKKWIDRFNYDLSLKRQEDKLAQEAEKPKLKKAAKKGKGKKAAVSSDEEEATDESE
jgi:hypothetical protein